MELGGFSMSVGILGGVAILWARETFHKVGGGARVLRHVQPLVCIGKEAIGLRVLLFIEQLSRLDERSRLGAKALKRSIERIVLVALHVPLLVPVVDPQNVLPVDAKALPSAPTEITNPRVR